MSSSVVSGEASGRQRCLARRRFPGGYGASARANGVGVDASGNVYVVGYTSGGLDGNTQSGNSDFFVAKYDSAGVKK
jgi:Beta-propeller repeat